MAIEYPEISVTATPSDAAWVTSISTPAGCTDEAVFTMHRQSCCGSDVIPATSDMATAEAMGVSNFKPTRTFTGADAEAIVPGIMANIQLVLDTITANQKAAEAAE